jgi:hypothetical protein
MIMRGKTPRTLPRFGLMGVCGLGVLLLPLVPSLAVSQQPAPGQVPGRGGDVEQEIQKLQKQLQHLQEKVAKDKAAKQDQQSEEVQKLYKLLNDLNVKHAKQVQEIYEQIKKLGGKLPQQPGFGGPPGMAPGMPGAPVPPVAVPPGITKWPQPGGTGQADMEKRVKDLEKRVEQLEKELHKKFSGFGQGTKGGFGLIPGEGGPGTGLPALPGSSPLPTKPGGGFAPPGFPPGQPGVPGAGGFPGAGTPPGAPGAGGFPGAGSPPGVNPGAGLPGVPGGFAPVKNPGTAGNVPAGQ